MRLASLRAEKEFENQDHRRSLRSPISRRVGRRPPRWAAKTPLDRHAPTWLGILDAPGIYAGASFCLNM
jgi:hypothetical protein